MKSPSAPSSCELEWERNLPEHARSVALKMAAVLGLSLSLSPQLFESSEFRLCVVRVTLNKATALIHCDTLIAPAELC